MALAEQLHGRLFDQAVCLETDYLAPLAEACREHRATASAASPSETPSFSRGTLYNTVVVIGPDGTMHNRHRKLMPTNPERMVWGFGDGEGPARGRHALRSRRHADLLGKLHAAGARRAVCAGHRDLRRAHLRLRRRWVASMQHIAREGGCWVAGSGHALRASDIPDTLPGKAQLYPDAAEWVNPGDSVIVAPGGKIVAGPMRNELGTLVADSTSSAGRWRGGCSMWRVTMPARRASAPCIAPAGGGVRFN